MSRCILCGQIHAATATCILRRSPRSAEPVRRPAAAQSWQATAERILLRDRHTCQMCGKRPPADELRVEHIVPLKNRLHSRQGRRPASGDENLRTLCRACYDWRAAHQRRW